MGKLMVGSALALLACSGLEPGSGALAPSSPPPTQQSSTSPRSPTPLPSDVVDPGPLVQHVRRLTAIVLRVDDVATKLMPSADYLGPGTVPGPAANVPAAVWVVAVKGEIRPSHGQIERPNSQCGLFAFRADTGEIWSTSAGSLTLCQPYFGRSLTPSRRLDWS